VTSSRPWIGPRLSRTLRTNARATSSLTFSSGSAWSRLSAASRESHEGVAGAPAKATSWQSSASSGRVTSLIVVRMWYRNRTSRTVVRVCTAFVRMAPHRAASTRRLPSASTGARADSIADRGRGLAEVEQQRTAALCGRAPVAPHRSGHELLHVGRGADRRADGLNFLGDRPVIEPVLGKQGPAPLLTIGGTLPLLIELFHLGLQVV